MSPSNASNPATINVANEKLDAEQGKLEPSSDAQEFGLGKKEMLTYRRPPWYLPLNFTYDVIIYVYFCLQVSQGSIL